MKTPRYVKILSVIGLLFAFWFALETSPIGPWLDLKYLKYQVKNNINPTDLQEWATTLLSEHSNHFQDFNGTTLPPGLKKVSGFGQDVEVNGDAVFVFCGRKGSPFLVVGAPTHVNTNFVHWKPGIYFVGNEHPFSHRPF